MKRGLFFLIALLLTACQRDLPTTPLSHGLIVQDLSAQDHLIQILDHQRFFDQISPNNGWIDRDHPYYAHDGQREFVFFDLEAEDEHRTLVVIFRHQQPVAATIIGYAPIESCYEDQPERTETDGWVFVYDLSQGLRCLTYYFAGQQLTRAEELPTDRGQQLDLLSQPSERSCLTDYFQHKPYGLNCHLLTELDILPRMQFVADDISQIINCLE